MVVCYTLANTWNLVWSVWPWLYVIPLRTRGIWCGVCVHGCMLYPCKHVEFSVEVCGHGFMLYPCKHVEFSVEVYGHGCLLYPCKHVEFSVEYLVMVVCYTLVNTWNLVWSI